MLAVVGDEVEQCLLVEVVEIVGVRDVGMLEGKETGHHVILAIIIEDVSHVATLLQKVAGTCQIVGPGLGLFGPRLVAVEPLSEDHQAKSGLEVIDGLVSALVYHKAIDAIGHLEVGCGLEFVREETVGSTIQSIGSE